MPGDTVGCAMTQNSNTTGLGFLMPLLAVLLFLAVSPLFAQPAKIIPVNIFGDGSPFNGVEDNRKPVVIDAREPGGVAEPRLNSGTISCDGRFRGTAMVVDTREFAPELKGVILMSAAHVVYDLDKKRLFRRCKFHFMGWDDDAGYRSKIDLKNMQMGDFDPASLTSVAEFGEGDWVFLYLPKPWKKYNPGQSLQPREFSFAQTESYQQSGGEFGLFAFDSSQGFISESINCTVIASENDDLGGGAWSGQLLDDCDSSDGASGGGIVAIINQRYYLIGIRNWSHWNEQIYPADAYPSGPPDGSVWDRRSNTNFGRAIDSHLLQILDQYIQSLN
jgi:hypothetical protein